MKSFTFFLVMIVLGTGNVIAQNKGSNVVDTDQESEHVFTKIEMGAQYPGGERAWSNFVKKNLKNISIADTAVKVEVSFVVDKNGAIKDITSKGGTRDLRVEAERVIRISGKWTPANACGRLVSAYKVVSILFAPR